MAFFHRKNRNENAFSGTAGRSLPDVIRHDCPEGDFISGYPSEAFEENSSLIVRSAQEAVLLADGEILYSFSPGTYRLSVRNYPLLSRMRNMLRPGPQVFNCRILFINKRTVTLPWKMPESISLVDPVTHIPTYIRCHGTLALQIHDGSAFVRMLADQSVSPEQPSVVPFLNSLLVPRIRAATAGFFTWRNLSLFDADAQMTELTGEIQSSLQAVAGPGGMTVSRFVFDEFYFPEKDRCQNPGAAVRPREIVPPEPDESEKYIFVSYAHKNRDTVIPLIRRMQRDNYSVWFDEGIDPGTEWDRSVSHKLRDCSFFIAAISKDYLSSDNCLDETYYAREMNKDRVLVYLEETALPPEMQMRHGRLQAIHLYSYQDRDAFFQKLYSAPGIEKCRKPSAAAP